MQLRFGVADRAAQHVGDFFVLVALHVVEQEYGSVTFRQLFDRRMKIHAIENASESQVWTANLESGPLLFAIGAGHFIEGNRDGSLLAKAHQNNVGGKTVQPR